MGESFCSSRYFGSFNENLNLMISFYSKCGLFPSYANKKNACRQPAGSHSEEAKTSCWLHYTVKHKRLRGVVIYVWHWEETLVKSIKFESWKLLPNYPSDDWWWTWTLVWKWIKWGKTLCSRLLLGLYSCKRSPLVASPHRGPVFLHFGTSDGTFPKSFTLISHINQKLGNSWESLGKTWKVNGQNFYYI